MSKKGYVMDTIVLALYVLFSALGLTLMKLGINKGFGLGVSGGILNFNISLTTLLGMLLYIASFILSLVVMSRMNLTYFYPLSAGLIYVVVCCLGLLLLKETVRVQQWIGMGLILLGVIAMNINK